MRREAEAVDFWALIAMIVLGVILGTCALSAFGEKTAQGPALPAGLAWSQYQDPFEKAFSLDVSAGLDREGRAFPAGLLRRAADGGSAVAGWLD